MATKQATLPRSGAFSKGYNFAYAWEKVGTRLCPPPPSAINSSGGSDLRPRFWQNAPVTEEQNAAISALSHAVAERPFPVNLVRRRSRICCLSYASLTEMANNVISSGSL